MIFQRERFTAPVKAPSLYDLIT